jgi:hypothetical protein
MTQRTKNEEQILKRKKKVQKVFKQEKDFFTSSCLMSSPAVRPINRLQNRPTKNDIVIT